MDKKELATLFGHLAHGDGAAFFERVADDVDWTVEGTHPLAGHYRSKQAFREGTFDKLGKVLPNGAELTVDNILMMAGRSSSSARMLPPATDCALTTIIAGSAALRLTRSLKSGPISTVG